MAETVAEATLKPVETNHELHSMLRALVHEQYPNLEKATIASFWMLRKPHTNWGNARPTNELEWWGSGVDIVVRVNVDLWTALTLPGRKGLLDHLLSCVDAKQAGNTTMQTARGVRTLFESRFPSLSVHPAVLARNPAFVAEIDELKSLHQSLSNPAQFLLDIGSVAPAPPTSSRRGRRASAGAPDAGAEAPTQ